jgi:hypothetical protein
MLAASPSANGDEVKQFLAALGEYTTSFDSKEKRETENVAYVAKTFNQQESDVKEWLSTVAWYHDLAKVESKVVIDTLQWVDGETNAQSELQLIEPFYYKNSGKGWRCQGATNGLERCQLCKRKGIYHRLNKYMHKVVYYRLNRWSNPFCVPAMYNFTSLS